MEKLKKFIQFYQHIKKIKYISQKSLSSCELMTQGWKHDIHIFNFWMFSQVHYFSSILPFSLQGM